MPMLIAIQLNTHAEPTIPISIYNDTNSKIAMLWTPRENWDNDIVSTKMVERLGAEVEQSDKDLSSVNFMGQTFQTKGHVQLKWGVERSKEVRTTYFLVAVTAEDPSFEIVLGRRNAIRYGLVQP
ncbi:hypothetical protein DIS24_g11074 [Lasiodiplodia hormozganensis]|uniref:Uncharacterized protein n=1 Tax=Lasiodiplodia hormozganensis TaxID=869390 RepID=A0AA39X2G9_9PEZI|nr:hypothetical protein DIS24_g11074 [Lasiodiplodia hormozganensis]